jgi:amidophosphoribosyltransferase
MRRRTDKLREECGVVAIHGHPDAARQAYLGLYALQHRGQESAGIATADGQRLANIKGMGLVSEIFTDDVLGQAARPHGDWPHALLHHRRLGAAQRAAHPR